MRSTARSSHAIKSAFQRLGSSPHTLWPAIPAYAALPEETPPSSPAILARVTDISGRHKAMGIPGNPAPDRNPAAFQRLRNRPGAGNRFQEVPRQDAFFIPNRCQIQARIPAHQQCQVCLEAVSGFRVEFTANPLPHSKFIEPDTGTLWPIECLAQTRDIDCSTRRGCHSDAERTNAAKIAREKGLAV